MVERVLYLTAAMTGMRQGELLALRWMDVDWIAHRVRVRRNFVRGKFGTPKSKRSSRSIPLADDVARELELLFQGSSYQGDEDLVFAHPHSGRPIDRSLLLKRFKAALKRAGVRELRFHDLRHTFGTRMAAAGVPMRTLQEWMGHRDFKTTLIYADYAPAANEAETRQRRLRPRRVHQFVHQSEQKWGQLKPRRPCKQQLTASLENSWVFGCGPGGRGFESPRSPLRSPCKSEVRVPSGSRAARNDCETLRDNPLCVVGSAVLRGRIGVPHLRGFSSARCSP